MNLSIGIMKAYSSCVGEGPFTTELAMTEAEKDALSADYSRLTEIDSRLCELDNSIWGNTGCESGICPL